MDDNTWVKEHSEFSPEQWKRAVAHDETRLGYWAWADWKEREASEVEALEGLRG